MSVESVAVQGIRCPHCGRNNMDHFGPTGRRPSDGDVSLCWVCKGIAIYTVGPLGTTGLRQPAPDELASLEADPKVRAALAAMAESYTPSQAIDLLAGRS